LKPTDQEGGVSNNN